MARCQKDVCTTAINRANMSGMFSLNGHDKKPAGEFFLNENAAWQPKINGVSPEKRQTATGNQKEAKTVPQTPENKPRL